MTAPGPPARSGGPSGTARLPPPVRTSAMTAVIRPIAARTVSHRPGGKRKSLLGPWPITSNRHTRSAQTPTSACNYPAALGRYQVLAPMRTVWIMRGHGKVPITQLEEAPGVAGAVAATGRGMPAAHRPRRGPLLPGPRCLPPMPRNTRPPASRRHRAATRLAATHARNAPASAPGPRRGRR